jgi:hypothetical protein
LGTGTLRMGKGAALVVGGILIAELLAEPAAPEVPEPIFEGIRTS